MASRRKKSTIIILAVLGAIFVISIPKASLAQEAFPYDDRELAELFAPVLYFHPAELFRPQSVDVMVNTARLRQAQHNWLDLNILPQVSLTDLFQYSDTSYNLDVWLGDEGASDFKNYSAHRAYYQSVLSPDAGGPSIVTYAHVVRDEHPKHVTIQYWLFYYYNDWFNKHEGDWEMVQVILSSSGDPEWVVMSQHHGGTRRPWDATRIELGTHPAVFVALGSHANFFWGDEIYPNGRTIGNTRVEIMDRTGTFGRIVPEVILIPDCEEVELDPDTWAGFKWLPFRGRWGEIAPQNDFSGPLGPAEKGDQWEQPYLWGMNQPLDLETWYKNRLRVEVLGDGVETAEINLMSSDNLTLPSVEFPGNMALMHADPKAGEEIIAEINVQTNSPYDIEAIWPVPEASETINYSFKNVQPGISDTVALLFGSGNVPVLFFEGSNQKQIPTTIEKEQVTWDAPDLVWVAGILPAYDVIKGVIISLIAGLFPTLVYVAILYNADRYEKEPKPLLAAAFIWGSIPAILVAIAVRVFFQLPVDLLGPKAIEAVRAGLISPLIEEALKGLAVLIIAIRYRLEFDDVLDGIVYGAMVGFGFAMTGNTLSYLGAFLLRGFAGLSNTIFIEGVLYGLNHGLYTAIFGAGLGYARLARKGWKRWAVPFGAFGLAVFGHALHNLAIRSAVGPNLLSLTVTWLGILVMVLVIIEAIRRQKRYMEDELIGELPDDIYQTLISLRNRRKAQWRALRKGGVRGLRDERRLHKAGAELALKKMQIRRRPNEHELQNEVQRLQVKIQQLIAAKST
jgi:RsiW-degrading membrane proteinase PrsW (M82 family)